ncbi:MAG: MFS transporter [Alphaproteobacteria bacterium]|nr:MFS transporter [Alphaproteobacteria bacterium]
MKFLKLMALRDYLSFARANLRFLAFGLVVAFTSSAGQTFFIGVFGPEVRAAFSLSHTEWGTIYMIGTLSSAALLTYTGGLIDRMDLRLFAGVVIAGLAGACFVMSSIQSVVALTVAIFLLRQMGQGLTSHTASTSMARYHGAHRGKALSLVSIGFTIGEAVLPVLAVAAIAAWGWRQTYSVSGFVVLAIIPIVLWLLKGHAHRHEQHLTDVREQNSTDASAAGNKTRWEMLREPRFYLLLPAAVAPSFIMTAMFFHHLTLAEAKGWSAEWVTGSYWVFGLSTVLALLTAGPLIDRLTAARIMPFYLLPLAAGLILLAPAEDPLWVLAYLFLGGINSGLYFAGLTALWAELYGVRHLGAIKSTVGAISVFASALGPVTVGVMLDLGFPIETVCLCFAAYCLLATPPLMRALRRPPVAADIATG